MGVIVNFIYEIKWVIKVSCLVAQWKLVELENICQLLMNQVILAWRKIFFWLLNFSLEI